jgi:large repetitive protein
MLTYDSVTNTFTFNAIDNSFAANYTVTLHAYDYASTATEHGTQVFTLDVYTNVGPSANETIPNLSATVHIEKIYTFTAFIFSEPEGETYSLSSYAITPSSAFITVDLGTGVITVDSATTPSNIGTYTVTLSATDGHPDTSIGTSSFNVDIVANSPPVINETLVDLMMTSDRTDTRILTSFAFYEPDGETLYIEGSFSPSISGLTFDNVTNTITSTCTSGDVGSYTFTLTAYDGHAENGNVTQTVRN